MPLNRAWQRCLIEIQMPVTKIFVLKYYEIIACDAGSVLNKK